MTAGRVAPNRSLLLAPAALSLAVGLAVAGGVPAMAHGKEVDVRLSCSAPDTAAPLTVRCEANVRFADGDPVSDVRLALSAVRPGRSGEQISGLPLFPTGQPGHYAATMELPAYGTWQLIAQVDAPAEGRVQVETEVLPPAGSSSPVGDAWARLVVGFGVRDIVNIVALAVHLFGTVALFAANGAVLFASFAQGHRDIGYRKSVAQLFPWVAGASLVLLSATGFYNALYNAPTRAPGLFHPATVAGLPFGRVYLVAFGAKMAFALALFIGTALLAVRLRLAPSWQVPSIVGARGTSIERIRPAAPFFGVVRRDECRALAMTNLITGGALLVMAVVAGYVHLLVHAGTFLSR